MTTASGHQPLDIEALVQQSIYQYKCLQLPKEWSQFLRLVADLKPRAVLEIGTFAGGSIWALSQVSAEDAVLVTVDLYPNPTLDEGPFRDQALARRPGVRPAVYPLVLKIGSRVVYRVIGNAHRPRVRLLVKAILAGHGVNGIDVLVLDADHTYGGVKKEFTAFSPLIRSGGIAGIFDFVESDFAARKNLTVGKFWREVKEGPGWDALVIKDDSDDIYWSNPARVQMGIGVLRRSGGGVPGADRPVYGWRHRLLWRVYRLYLRHRWVRAAWDPLEHLVTRNGERLIHAPGWLARKLWRKR